MPTKKNELIIVLSSFSSFSLVKKRQFYKKRNKIHFFVENLIILFEANTTAYRLNGNQNIQGAPWYDNLVWLWNFKIRKHFFGSLM